MKFFNFITKKEIKRIKPLIAGNYGKLFTAIFCMSLVSLTTSATAFLIKPVLDDIFLEKKVAMLKILPVAILVLYLVRGVSRYFSNFLINYIGEAAIRKLRDKLYTHICYLPLSFFHKQKTGILMSHITNDINTIKNMTSKSVTGIMRDAVTIIGLIFVIFYRDWKLALCAIVVVPLGLYPIAIFGKKIRKISTGSQEKMADINSFLHESLVGNKIIKIFRMEKHEIKRFLDKNFNFFKIQMKAVKINSLSSPSMELLGGIGIAFIIWFGGSRVISGISTPGTFFSFMAATLMLYEPVKRLSELNNSVQNGLACMDRVFDIIGQETEKTDEGAELEDEEVKEIAFKNLCFSYNAGKQVLTDINLSVKKGESIAFVGASGGGKSTLLNLLPRFFNPDSGQILINNKDIQGLSLSTLRAKISVVTQDPILFNDTIKNNIAYGKFDASFEEIKKAAKDAFAYDFIMRTPNQFESTIGELGSMLSGGEKQRICIARALLKNAPILILDEATSALDSQSETLVQNALSNLIQNKTTFVIAHRLSTIQNADKIFVIKDGKIQEEGTHKELMIMQGEYHKLYTMQLQRADS